MGMRPCCASMCSRTSGIVLSWGRSSEVERLFARRYLFDRHIEPLHLVEQGDEN